MNGLHLKISKARIEKLVHYTIILIAGLSTVLRSSMESKITLFRLILPFIFFWYIWTNPRRGLKFIYIASFFLVYSVVVSYLSRFHAFSIVYNLYYVTTIFFFFYYKEVVKKCGPNSIFVFFTWVYKILIVLGFIQMFFGGVYINTQDRLPAVNIFFWNENEFSSVLAIFTPLYFLGRKSVLKYIWILAAFTLVFFNGAKLALWALLIFFGGYFVMRVKIFKTRYIGFFLLTIVTIVTLLFFKNHTIEGKFTVEFLTSDLIKHIFSQEAYKQIGSFNSRANAVILGIKEFVNSYFLGIGPGNSLLMIQEVIISGKEQYAAKSMHNFTLQIITEMGIFGLFLLYIFYLKVKQVAAISEKYPRNLIWIFYLSAIISVTLLSGAWSNYFYLFILFYSLDFFKYNV